MSTPKPSKDTKIGVQISKETGGAYADVREVIESELARIRGGGDVASKASNNGTASRPDSHSDKRNGDKSR